MSLILNELKIANKLVTTGGGSIGIGKSVLNAPLDVSGNAIVTGSLTVASGNGNGDSSVLTSGKLTITDPFNLVSVGLAMSGSSTAGRGQIFANNAGMRVQTTGTAGKLFLGTIGDISAMTIDASGNIGINNTSPSYKLHVTASSGTVAYFSTPGGGDVLFTNGVVDSNSSQFGFKALSGNKVYLGANGTQHLTIDTNGNVGIGETNPTQKLYINTGGSTGGIIVNTGATTTSAFIRLINSNQNWDVNTQTNNRFAVYDQTNSKQPFTIEPNAPNNTLWLTASGNIGIGTNDPKANLHVYGGTATLRVGPWFSSSDRDFIELQAHGTDTKILSPNERFIIQNTAGDIILDPSGGNLGIGKTAPVAKVDINGNSIITGSLTVASGNGNGDTSVLTSGRLTITDPFNLTSVGLAMSGSSTAGRGQIFANNAGMRVQTTGTAGKLFLGTIGDASAITIDANGNIGIGTTVPAQKIHIQSGAATTLLRIDNTDSNNDAAILLTDNNNPTGEGFKVTYDSSVGDTYFNNIYTTSTNAFHFQNGDFGSGTELITIKNDGNVSIGKTNPSAKLDVSGSTVITGSATVTGGVWSLDTVIASSGLAAGFWLAPSAGGGPLGVLWHANNTIQLVANSGKSLAFSANGTEAARINTSGNFGIGTSAPLTKLHAYTSSADTTTAGRTTALNVLTLETENTGDLEYNGFGQGLVFRGSTYNNTTQRTLGRIVHKINDDSVSTTRGTSIHFETSDNATNSNAPTEKMVINYVGSVGIGIAAPTSKLHVTGDIRSDVDNSIAITLNRSATNVWCGIGHATAGSVKWFVGLRESGDNNIRWYNYTNTTERMVLTEGGNLGIGQTTPNAKLDVNGGIGLASNYNLFWGAATNDQTVGVNTPAIVATTGAGFYIVPNGSTTGTTLRIAADGNVGIGIGTTASSYKLEVGGTGKFSNSLTANSFALDGGFTISNSGAYGQTSNWLGMTGHGVYTTGTTYMDLDGATSTYEIRGYNNDTFAKFESTGTANTARKITFLTNGGNFGVGIDPVQKFHVDGPVGNPGTTGTTQSGILRLSNVTDNAVLDIGMRGGGAGAWLQSTDETSLAANYPLLLNPNGGNVGINKLSSNAPLDVNGNVVVTGSVTVTSNITASSIQVVNLNVSTVSSSVVYSSGSNTFGNSTSNKQQFTGSVQITGSLGINGIIGFGSKPYTVTNSYTTGLTINLTQHTGIFIRVTLHGDLSSNSAIAYMGEFFIQNGDGSYAEPGIIIREVNNTNNGSAVFSCQIVDPAGTGARNFEMQFKQDSATASVGATLIYQIQGNYNSVS